MVVVVLREEHEKVILELNGFRKTLGKTKSALDAMQSRVHALELGQARIQALESGQVRMEVQLDLLIRIQQPMERPTYAAQAPPNLRRTDIDMA